MNLLETLSEKFEVPIIRESQKIWFFRTKAGRYYNDFKINNYIALGWDKISPAFITNQDLSSDSKKEQIEEIYPDEKRPGLILGQADTFYIKMQSGDLVVIPSEGGKEISIGVLGNIQTEVKHKPASKEYDLCTFRHKREVKWVKVVNTLQDVYLFKALRAQQTISDITECGSLVLRNLFPIYISETGVHITLKKENEESIALYQNVDLQYNFLKISDTITNLYGMPSMGNDICLRTAVGSPGFLEIILPHVPGAIPIVLTIRTLIGSLKSSDGKSTGMIALIQEINAAVDAYHQRKRTDAEAEKLQAEAKRTLAEADLKSAEADKVRAETRKINLECMQIELMANGKTNIQIEEENEKLDIPDEQHVRDQVPQIVDFGHNMQKAMNESGLSLSEKIDAS